MIAQPDTVPRGTKVYLNGKLAEAVFYADDVRGIVDCYRQPYKIHKHKKRAISNRYRGKVEILLPNGYEWLRG